MSGESRSVKRRIPGSFDTRDEAAEFIRYFAQLLTELDLQERFTVDWTPQRVLERRRTAGGGFKVVGEYWQINLHDATPDIPMPSNLLSRDDLLAAKARIKDRDTVATQQPEPEVLPPGIYEAFGRRNTIAGWARSVGVTPATVYNRLKKRGNLEDVLTDLALKNQKIA